MHRRERDMGQRPGLTSTELERVKQLERESKELRRTNGIVRLASVGSMGQRNSNANWLAGVSKASFFRGRAFNSAAT
jgi:hypothetical protein